MKKLTERQEKFCQEFAKCGNATEAYKKAGYKSKSDKAVTANASRLIAYDSIQQRLRELAARVQTKKIMDIAEMQERLTAFARQESEEEIITVKGVRMMCQVGAKDALKAMELLAKIQGGFAPVKSDVTISEPVVILHDDVPEE